MLLLVLGLISLVIVIFWNPVFEHMTNKAMKAKMDFHAQDPGHWDIEHSAKNNNKSKLAEQTIRGPKVPPIDPNQAGKSALDPDAGKTSAVYPEIFGPDSTNAPGHLDSTNTTSPIIASPKKSDISPSPYLNDFSKLMK